MRSLFTILFVVIAVSGFEKNPYFATEQELETWFWDSTSTGTEKRLLFELVDTTEEKALWKIETRCFCELDWSVYLLYDWNKDSIICGHGLIAGVDFGGEEFSDECNKIVLFSEIKAKSKESVRYFLKKEISNSIQQIYSSASSLFIKKEMKSSAGFATDVVEYKYWHYLPITPANVTQYNDLGYFLEQGGKYKEAVILLTEVVKAVPDRTVAYLNLADAYWGLADTVNARQNYCRYIELLRAGTLENKIPQRVTERCGKCK